MTIGTDRGIPDTARRRGAVDAFRKLPENFSMTATACPGDILPEYGGSRVVHRADTMSAVTAHTGGGVKLFLGNDRNAMHTFLISGQRVGEWYMVLLDQTGISVADRAGRRDVQGVGPRLRIR